MWYTILVLQNVKRPCIFHEEALQTAEVITQICWPAFVLIYLSTYLSSIYLIYHLPFLLSNVSRYISCSFSGKVDYKYNIYREILLLICHINSMFYNYQGQGGSCLGENNWVFLEFYDLHVKEMRIL